MAPVAPDITMQYTLGYVVGNDPAAALEHTEFRGSEKGDQPSWSVLARRSNRYMDTPHVLVLRDGTLVSESDVGEDVMKEVFGALDDRERITVVALRS